MNADHDQPCPSTPGNIHVRREYGGAGEYPGGPSIACFPSSRPDRLTADREVA